MSHVPLQYTNLDKRREVLEWRDKHMAEIEIRLQKEISSLMDSVRQACSQMRKSDLSQIEAHYQNTIQPICNRWISSTEKTFVDAAIKDFPLTTSTSTTLYGVEGVMRRSENMSISTDSRVAKVAIAASVSAVPITASMATVSAGGLAGLFGVTVIAWPVVAAGAIIGGGLLLFGGKSLAGKAQKEKINYETKLLDLVRECILGRSEYGNSLLLILQQRIEDIASKALKETKW